MTNTSNAVSETELLKRVSADYRQLGYEVMVQPGADILPSPLRDWQIDLVARRDNQNVVVEIKRSNQAVANRHLRSLAEKIGELSGWRLDVVIGDDSGHFEQFVLPFAEISELTEQLADGKELCETGHIIGGGLQIWAAFEAILHKALAESGSAEAPHVTFRQLLATAVSLGYLDDPDIKFLRQAEDLRNQFAHGANSSPGDSRVFLRVAELAEEVLRRMTD